MAEVEPSSSKVVFGMFLSLSERSTSIDDARYVCDISFTPETRNVTCKEPSGLMPCKSTVQQRCWLAHV
jgi:hypothetical protein